MLPIHKNPLGFKNLRTWQQANEIFAMVESFCASFPTKHPETGQYLTDLKDQMIRSARSVVRNIEEGFARNTTHEYIQFLGYSMGSLQELIGDFEYCLKGNIGEKAKGEKGYWLAKGEAKMLQTQISSLEKKTIQEKTLPHAERLRRIMEQQSQQEKAAQAWLQQEIERQKS